MQTQKRKFSDQEFDIMVEQLIMQKPASFDMLCQISEKTLHGWVIYECRRNAILHDKQLEDDIFHDIQIRLIQKTVTDFLLKDGTNGEVNRNPDGFKSWMFAVAGNLIKDTAKKYGLIDYRYRTFLEGEEETFEDDENIIDSITSSASQERDEKLRRAVSIVLESKSQPYIVLTWLAMCLFMLDSDVSKIASNHLVFETFVDKSLYEMFDVLKKASKKIQWLYISREQEVKMMDELSKKTDAGKTYGEMTYREYFMKKDAMSSISDLENRMNSLVKRVMNNETSNCQ